jgi:hypothetical protein
VKRRLVEHRRPADFWHEPKAVRQDVPRHHRESGLIIRREYTPTEIEAE